MKRESVSKVSFDASGGPEMLCEIARMYAPKAA
jgi:hypothetical protein